MTNEKIEAKKAEVANYERILREYRSGRWYDMGRRRLDELKQELSDLENSQAEEASEESVL